MTGADHSHEATVVVDPADVEKVKKLAAEHNVGLEVIEQEGLTGFEVLLVIYGPPAAVAFVIDLIEHRKGGQVFDLRPGATRIAYRTPDVMYGLVVIIGVDGSVKVEVKEPKMMFAQVATAVHTVIGDCTKSPLSVVARELGKRIGDAATINVEPKPVD